MSYFLLRNSRSFGIPDVIRAAQISVEAGAQGITVHPRPDERHIKPSDIFELAKILTVEFNIEGNPFFPQFIEIVRKVKPTQCTLVPDLKDALTSDHGWDLFNDSESLRPIIQELKNLDIRVVLLNGCIWDKIERNYVFIAK